MKTKLTNIIGSFLMYLSGFLIGLGGATILYIESSANLSCHYVKGCETRNCQIDCTLDKQWGGFITIEQTPINNFKGISSRYYTRDSKKIGEQDTHLYGLVIEHQLGEIELLPMGGQNHHFPSRDSVVQKTNDFTNSGPSDNILQIWQVNWVMLLIGYGLILIWPLQILNIFLTIKQKLKS